MSAGTPAGGNTWKNIIIGILTTVVAYTIVHFLGIGKSENGKDEEKQKKEATVNGWKSVNDYINYSNQKFKTIACFSCDLQEMKKEMIRELEINSNNLRNLKEDKNIDEKMLSIIDRTIQQFNDLKPLYSDYFDSLSAMRKLPLKDQTKASSLMQSKYLEEINHIQTRDSSDTKHYLEDVNKKYKTKLIITPLQPEFIAGALPGKWKIECSFEIEFRRNGTLVWRESGTDFPGTWKLDDKLLTIHLETKQVFEYSILILSPKILIYYDSEHSSYLAACPQQ